jgi:hypothetical protein
VHGRTGRAIAGATVSWLDDRDPKFLDLLQEEEDVDLGQLAEARGKEARTDENGEARLRGSPMILRARAGELWNEVVFPSFDDGALRLPLLPDLAIRIEDERGVACPGVAVGVEVHHTAVARSGADGRVLFSHVEITMSPGAGPVDSTLPPREIQASFAFPIEPNQRLVLASDDIPEEPFEWVLPATGKVLVELRDLDGRLLEEPARVQLLSGEDPGRDDEGEAPGRAGTFSSFPTWGSGSSSWPGPRSSPRSKRPPERP